jgi:sugar O-acyltransferase (sialic acid O-acetyltransferase NeuD family)
MNIAGCSENLIALLLECYHRSRPDPVRVRIFRNVPHEIDPDVPFLPPNDSVTFDISPMNEHTNEWFIGVGQPLAKQSVLRSLCGGRLVFPNVIDPSVRIASTATIGVGALILENVVVASFAVLGDFVTVNRQSSIGHHTSIGGFTTLSPGVHIAGHCRIGRGVTIGIGAVVCDHVSVGDGSVIGAGSVVTRSIPPNVVAYGSPARVIRSIDKSD